MKFRLVNKAVRENCSRCVMTAPEGWIVSFHPPKRTLEQNAKLWAMLADIARQVEWHGEWLTAEEWKDVFTAALKKTKVVPGLYGGYAICGRSTSKMTKADMAELIELMYAFGAGKSVEWSEPDAQIPNFIGHEK